MSPAGLSTTTWHAHEMIYGYVMAVVAGFLLTAVGNWTGINDIHTLRMWDWYTKGIWKKPLLWSLYLGYAFMVLGFLLKALSV